MVHLPDGTKRPVQVGRTSLTHAEILEGLSPGETVALSPVEVANVP